MGRISGGVLTGIGRIKAETSGFGRNDDMHYRKSSQEGKGAYRDEAINLDSHM